MLNFSKMTKKQKKYLLITLSVVGGISLIIILIIVFDSMRKSRERADEARQIKARGRVACLCHMGPNEDVPALWSTEAGCIGKCIMPPNVSQNDYCQCQVSGSGGSYNLPWMSQKTCEGGFASQYVKQEDSVSNPGKGRCLKPDYNDQCYCEIGNCTDSVNNNHGIFVESDNLCKAALAYSIGADGGHGKSTCQRIGNCNSSAIKKPLVVENYEKPGSSSSHSTLIIVGVVGLILLIGVIFVKYKYGIHHVGHQGRGRK